jgi:hypothetical protein
MSTKSKSQLSASTALIRAPCLVVTANIRGGCGKTTTALTIADLMAMNGVEVVPFQVDEQPQLANLLGRSVVSLLPKLGDVTQARALTSPFSPLYAACQKASESGAVVLVDVGANMVELFARWLRNVELQEDLEPWKMAAVLLVPAVRETAAVEGAIETLALLRTALPAAVPVFIENQRDEAFSTVKPNAELGRLLRERLPVALEGCARITMPAIEGDAWQSFEAAGLRFLKALALSPVEVAALIQEDVAEAKIMRSYIVRYLRSMHAEYGRIFALPEGGA